MSFFQLRAPYFKNPTLITNPIISVGEDSAATENVTVFLPALTINTSDASTVTDVLIQILEIDLVNTSDTVLARDTRTNYLMNPSFETNDLFWGLGGGSKAQSTSFYNTGKASLQFIGSAIDDKVYATVSDGLPSPVVGKPYTFSAYLRGSGQLKLWVYDGSADQYSASLITLTSTWTRYSLTVTCGGSGMLAGLRLTTTNAVTAYMDNTMFEEGSSVDTYFDGGTWGAIWSGTTDQSTSSTAIAGTTIAYRSPLATLNDPQRKAAIHTGSYSIDTANTLTQTDINKLVKAIATSIPNTDYITIGSYLDYVAQIRMWIYAIRAAGKKVWIRSAGYNDWRGSNGITQYTSADFASHSTTQYVSFINTNYDIFQAGDIFETVPDEPENNSMWNTTYGTIGSGTGLTAYNTFITDSISQVNTALAANSVKGVDTGYVHTSPSASRDIITNATASVLTSMATDHYPEAVTDTTGTACGTAMHNELAAYVTGQHGGKRYHLTIGPNVNIQLSSSEQVNAYNSEWGYIQTDVVPLDGLTVWQSGGTGDPLSRLFDYASGAWTPRSAAATVNTIFGQVPQGQVSEKVTSELVNNINVFDTASILENITIQVPTATTLAISVFDTSTVTDVVVQILEIDLVNVFDSSIVTDVITQVLKIDLINVFDGSTVTDVITQILQIYTINVFDSSIVTDVITQILQIYNINVFENSTVTDVPTVLLPYLIISVSDSSTVTDVLTQVLQIYNINTSDASTVTDVIVQVLETYNINTSDASTITDVVIQALEIDFVNVFENLTATDAPTVFLPYLTISLFEASTVTDVITQILETYNINVFDNSTVTDVITQILEIDFVNVFDSSIVTDVVTQIAIFNTIGVFDNSAATDVITQILEIDNINVFDSSIATDVITQILEIDFVNVFDSSTASDVLTQILQIYNPSVNDYAIALDVRQNRIPNPSFEVNTTGWSLNGAYSRSTDRAMFGTASLKFTNAAAGLNVSSSISPNLNVSAGATYTFSVYIYVVGGYVGNASVDIIELASNGVQVLDGPNTNFTLTDQWQRISVTQTMNTKTAFARLRFVTDGNAVGTAYFDGAMFESGPTATTYIDGTQPGCSWDGAANASTSSSSDVTVIPEIINNISVGEDSATAENLALLIPILYINTFDASAASENVIIETIDDDTIFDSSIVSEFVAVDIPIVISVSDSSTVTDAITQALKIDLVNVFDGSTVTDVITQILLTDFISVSDSSTVTDVIVQILKTNYVSIKIETVGVSEVSGYGLAFNGGTSGAGTGTLTVANQTAFQTLTSLTVEAWIYMQEISTTLGRVVDYQRSAPTNDGFFMWCNANHAGLSFGVIADNVQKSVNSVDFSLNTWHHIAGTWDGATVRIFVDGVLSSSIAQTGTSTSNPAHALLIGNSGGGREFPGVIDEVRISNTARYTSNFTAPTSEFATDANTLLLLHMNDGSGTTVIDSSGNGFNGTNGGIPLPQWIASSAPINPFLGQILEIDNINTSDNSAVTEFVSGSLPIGPSISDSSIVTEFLAVMITDFISPSDSSIITENFGYALHFDGIDDWITLGVSGFESQIATQGLYIKMQIRSTASSATFLYGDKAVGNGGMTLSAVFNGTYGQNIVNFGMQDNTGANRNGFLVKDVLDGQTHIIEVTYLVSGANSNFLSISVDGDSTGFVNGSGQGQGNTTYDDFRVGFEPGGSDGAFDCDYLLLGHSDGTTITKTAEFSINDGYSTTITDITGHGNTGTIVDATWTTPLTNVTNVEIVNLIPVSDASTASDTIIQVLNIYNLVPSDASTVSENITIEILDSISQFDASTVSENIVVEILDAESLFDTSTVTEFSAVELLSLVSQLESVMATDLLDYGLQFDGTQNYVQGSNFPRNNDEISVSIWLNEDTYISGKRAASVTNNFEIDLEGTGAAAAYKLRLNQTVGTTFFSIPSANGNPLTNAGLNVHLVFVASLSGNYVRGYINGVKQLDTPYGALTPMTTGTGTIFLGRYSSGQFFNGTLDNFRIWNTALTDNEVAGLYKGTVPQTSNQKLAWLLNEGQGTTVADSSGNGFTGSFVGTPSPNWVTGIPGTTNPTLTIIDNISVSDSPIATEFSSVLIPILYISVGDDSTVSESVSANTITSLSIFDSSVATDFVSQVLVTSLVSVTDNSTITESVSVAPFLIINPTEDSVVTDIVIVEILDAESLFDASTVTEFSQVILVNLVNQNDSSIVTDVLTRILEIYCINKAEVSLVTDTLTGQNGGIWLNPLDITVFEALGPYFLIFLTDGRTAIRLFDNFYQII